MNKKQRATPINLWYRLAGLFLGLVYGYSTLLFAAPVRELQVWTSSENVARALTKLGEEFEVDFKAKLKISVLNKDLTTQFKTAAIAGKGPDIFCWAGDVVGELASSGLIEPIILPKEMSEQYLASALDSFTFEGKLYGYPYDIEAVALIRNTRLLKEAPKSYEELAKWSKNFQRDNPKKYGFLFDIKNFYFNFSFLAAMGGYIFGESEQTPGKLDPNNIGLASEGAVKGAEFLASLVRDGVIPSSTDRNVAFEKFLAGDLAVMIDGPWAVSDLLRSDIPFDVSPLPTLGGSKARPLVGTHGFIIRRSSKNKDLAKEFIERYLISATGMATLYEEDPRGPARVDSLVLLKERLSPEMLHYLEQFFTSASVGVPMPNISAMGPVWSSMGASFDLILQKKVPAQSALNDAKTKIEAAIKATKREN